MTSLLHFFKEVHVYTIDGFVYTGKIIDRDSIGIKIIKDDVSESELVIPWTSIRIIERIKT